ncbi:MAG TPA: GntR family transcriptional regulator [Ktedonobacterales bacterium]|jgi:GntR family transcriptional regulator
MIEFHLDGHSGVAPYLQLVQQVKQALRLGLLVVGDQLPTVREVVGQITINPNTVLKAYRELEREGLVASRPGQGTFVQRTLAGTSLSSHAALRRSLTRWLHSAYEAGLDSESVLALFMSTFQDTQREREETA